MGVWGDISPGAPLATDLADISVVTTRIDNLVDGLDGTDSLGGVDINGGAIDGTPIGVTTASQGFFTQFSATGSAVFNFNVTFSQNVTFACILVANASMTVQGIHSISGIIGSSTANFASALTVTASAAMSSGVAAGGGGTLLWTLYSGTTDANSAASFAHGLVASDIVSLNGMIYNGTGYSTILYSTMALSKDLRIAIVGANIVITPNDVTLFQNRAYRVIAHYVP